MNMCTIVGRLCKNPEVRETETGKKVTNVTVAVSRSYKNSDGEYDVDYIDCVLWNNIAENTAEFCKKGDIVGNKSKRYTDKVQIIIALFINDFKGIFFFVISDMIK